MKIQAKLNQSNNEYKMNEQQRVTIQAVNVGEKNTVVRFYEGEISASNYITEINLPPRIKTEKYITVKNLVCEITSDKVAVGVFHD